MCRDPPESEKGTGRFGHAASVAEHFAGERSARSWIKAETQLSGIRLPRFQQNFRRPRAQPSVDNVAVNGLKKERLVQRLQQRLTFDGIDLAVGPSHGH